MELVAAAALGKFIGAGLAAIGSGAAAIGVGHVAGNYLAGALRNPSAAAFDVRCISKPLSLRLICAP